MAHLNRIMKLRLICGHYHYTGNSKIISFFMKLYCFIFLLLILSIYCSIVTYKIDLKKIHTYIFLEFFAKCLLSLIFGGNLAKTLYSLINVTQNFLKKEVISVTCKLYVILMSVGLLWILSSTLNNNYNLWIACVSNIYVTVSYISNILIIDVLYNCMKYLRKSFDYKKVYIYFMDKDIIDNIIVKLNNNMTVYKHIIDFIDNIDSEIQIWVIFSLHIKQFIILILKIFDNRIICPTKCFREILEKI